MSHPHDPESSASDPGTGKTHVATALAAASEVASNPLVAVAYGLAYPVGAVGGFLFAQLIPRWPRASARRGGGRTAGSVLLADFNLSAWAHSGCRLAGDPS